MGTACQQGSQGSGAAAAAVQAAQPVAQAGGGCWTPECPDFNKCALTPELDVQTCKAQHLGSWGFCLQGAQGLSGIGGAWVHA